MISINIFRLYWNLKTALYPVMRINKTGLESAIFGKHADIINDVIKNGENGGICANVCPEDEDDF